MIGYQPHGSADPVTIGVFLSWLWSCLCADPFPPLFFFLFFTGHWPSVQRRKTNGQNVHLATAIWLVSLLSSYCEGLGESI